MKRMSIFPKTILMLILLVALTFPASAIDYRIETTGVSDYYPSTSYDEIVGSQYNYGGANVVDFQTPELEYGVFSTTQTGVMERVIMPGLQAYVSTSSDGGYGLVDIETIIPEIPGIQDYPIYKQPAYTSVDGMKRADGSIGTLKIPSLGINMKVWEGETSSSMKKGLGHYTSTSGWNGNVGVCGHNRGSKYVIGDIKELQTGDKIIYTTVYGTRTYAVSDVKIISSSDWSDLQATADNRITITTCLADHPEKRVCVQAVEVA